MHQCRPFIISVGNDRGKDVSHQLQTAEELHMNTESVMDCMEHVLRNEGRHVE